MENETNKISDNLTLNEYQDLACLTLMEKPDFELTDDEKIITLTVLALAVTVAGLAEKVKKGIFHRQGLSIAEFESELDSLTAKSLLSISGIGDDVKFDSHITSVVWNTLGLIGESGEVGQLALNSVITGTTDYLEQLFKKELGDVDWYRAAIARKLGLTLGEIGQHNIEKLIARFPDGYSHDRTTYRGTGAE